MKYNIENEVVKIRCCQFYMREDGILVGYHFPGIDNTLDDAKEAVQTALSITKGKPVPLLIDMRDLQKISLEARKYYSNVGGKKVAKGLALLIGSSVSKIIGNFFIGLDKQEIPTKLFTQEKEAILWLKQF